jgi:cyclopropane-fatty-acyl-phospholipid synthase
MRLLSKLLSKFVRKGRLTVLDADGKTHVFGSGQDGPDVTIRLHSAALERKLFLNPELATAEAYMDGTLTVENGGHIHDFLLLFSENRSGLYKQASHQILRTVMRRIRRFHQHNTILNATRNAKHHYNLSTELYRQFLDKDLNYSCAYFLDPENETLEQAQRNKLIHATTKLDLKPGMTVAEIGSGWGSFAIHLARETGAHVTAINVTPEQIRVSREEAAKAGVADRVAFVEMDYRKFEGKFDRVVSVGMAEHVGVAQFDAYFGKVYDLLKDDGFAFIHLIGRMSVPGTIGPFIRKYIFPGGYTPALSEVSASTERSHLWICDLEMLRLHYAWTLARWRERFRENRDKVKAIYDERFCRMWEFYLSAAELEFVHGSHLVFQLLLSKKRDAVPLRRDYMFDAEREARKKIAAV